MLARAGAWSATAALVVLGARFLAYALSPQPTALSLQLEHSAGGPRLLVVALWSLALGSALASAALGLAWLAVRERLALERRIVVARPRLRPLRFGRRSAALFAATAAAFTLLESYLHWRAGLGWHGLHCLTGPVHRDAIPLLAALSVVAAACAEAVDHLVAWSRRTLGRLLPSLPVPAPAEPASATRSRFPLTAWRGASLPARGPPPRLRSVTASAI